LARGDLVLAEELLLGNSVVRGFGVEDSVVVDGVVDVVVFPRGSVHRRNKDVMNIMSLYQCLSLGYRCWAAVYSFYPLKGICYYYTYIG
jgi:hypothetical protein